MRPMRTHAQIVREAGSVEEVALWRKVSVNTVRSWMQRDSLPAEHWAAFAREGKADLTELANAAASRRQSEAA